MKWWRWKEESKLKVCVGVVETEGLRKGIGAMWVLKWGDFFQSSDKMSNM